MNDLNDPNQTGVAGASGQNPAAQNPPAQGGTNTQAKKGNLGGIMDDDVDVSQLVANAGQNQSDSQVLTQMAVPAHPNTKFDDKTFVNLLAGSISLTLNEKKKIIQAIPQLSQFQIDELIKIFNEEKGKFAELEQKHSKQIEALEQQHAVSPDDLALAKEEEVKRDTDAEEAEAIKRQLGL